MSRPAAQTSHTFICCIAVQKAGYEMEFSQRDKHNSTCLMLYRGGALSGAGLGCALGVLGYGAYAKVGVRLCA